MITVKAVKAVTEVTLQLTGDEASLLKQILIDGVPWDDSPAGMLSGDLYEALDVAGIE